MSSSGNSDKKGTQLSVDEFINRDIYIGEKTSFKNINFTVNNLQDNSVNFIIKDNLIKCISDYDISVMSMLMDYLQ